VLGGLSGIRRFLATLGDGTAGVARPRGIGKPTPDVGGGAPWPRHSRRRRPAHGQLSAYKYAHIRASNFGGRPNRKIVSNVSRATTGRWRWVRVWQAGEDQSAGDGVRAFHEVLDSMDPTAIRDRAAEILGVKRSLQARLPDPSDQVAAGVVQDGDRLLGPLVTRTRLCCAAVIPYNADLGLKVKEVGDLTTGPAG